MDLSIAICAVAAGPVAGDDLERVDALVRVDCDAERDAVAADRLAGLVGEADLVLDRALCDADAGQLLDPVEHVRREGRSLFAAVVGAGRDLGADDRVGGGIRLVVDAVEALAERVGEHEAAADHRDAEHDRERRQNRAELAAEQSFEGDADHRVVTSWSVSRISCEVDGPRSLTIRPSARKRMRSAIAAACASWVTITVVWP